MTVHKTILRQLLHEPATMAKLQAAAQVSLPTLRKAVQDLTEAGWIQVVGHAEANGGRPAMLYGVNESGAILAGLHLQLPGLHMIVTDLKGNVLEERDLFEGEVPAQTQSITAVSEAMEEISAAYPGQRIIGIGIASPGFIDPQTGDIITIGRVPAWSNFPFCRRLQTAVGLPVHIANDIDCMAFAEFEYSKQPLSQNLVYIGFDEGVKASMYLNGEIYRGALGNAGLISSRLLRVEEGIAAPADLLSIAGVLRRFEEQLRALPEDWQKPCQNILESGTPRTIFQTILRNAHSDMTVCHDLVLELINALSAAVANLIYIVQPDSVVIGGFLSLLPRGLYDQLETSIRTKLPALISNNLVIQQALLTSQNSAAAGAVQHFLKSYLSDPDTDLLQTRH